MRIICVLQNAWAWGGFTRLPIVFAPNPDNKSAKQLKRVCGDHPYWFCNTTGVVTDSAAGKAAIDTLHFVGVINRLHLEKYDAVLVCGKQAAQAVRSHIEAFKALNVPIVFMPHPASRTLKRKTLEAANEVLYDMLATKAGLYCETIVKNEIFKYGTGEH